MLLNIIILEVDFIVLQEITGAKRYPLYPLIPVICFQAPVFYSVKAFFF